MEESNSDVDLGVRIGNINCTFMPQMKVQRLSDIEDNVKRLSPNDRIVKRRQPQHRVLCRKSILTE